MKIQADGFDFEFPDALDAFIFDETDRGSPNFHGLSHAMKAVDMIVELENDDLFVEVKDFHRPDDYQEGGHFNHLRNSLKYKYRDTFLYRWAARKIDKPIRFLCLLTLENGLITRMNREMRIQIPWGLPVPRWERLLPTACAVLNEERWNHNFPNWPVRRI